MQGVVGRMPITCLDNRTYLDINTSTC